MIGKMDKHTPTDTYRTFPFKVVGTGTNGATTKKLHIRLYTANTIRSDIAAADLVPVMPAHAKFTAGNIGDMTDAKWAV